MITELVLDNWKSYDHACLQIDPLTVLIGTNASGKSNALDALALLNRVASGALLTAALQGDSTLSALRGGVEWAVRKPKDQFSIGINCQVDELTSYEYKLECIVRDARCDVNAEHLIRIKHRSGRGGRREVGRIHIYRTDMCQVGSPTIAARLYNKKTGNRRDFGRSQPILFQMYGQKAAQEIEQAVNFVGSALRDIFILDPIPSHMRAYSPLAESLDSDAKNIAGVIAALPPAKQKELEEVLTRYASKLPERDIRRVYAETVGKFNSDAMLYCEEDWTDGTSPHTVDARGMSDGTLRFLAILAALQTRPPGSLLVIEEVDNGLHPSRSNMLLDMLKTVGKSRRVDVLATTHNPALLDAMGPEMVPYITVAHRDATNGHSVLTLLEDIKQLPKLLAQGSIGRLSSRGLLEKAVQQSLNFE